MEETFSPRRTPLHVCSVSFSAARTKVSAREKPKFWGNFRELLGACTQAKKRANSQWRAFNGNTLKLSVIGCDTKCTS